MSTGDGRRHFALVATLFGLSGAAGLVYQVIWMRRLGLFLGSDLFSVSIILSAFMGGLALGSLVGGRLSERTSRPLAWYGAAELGIGVFALSFSGILTGFDPVLRAVYPETDPNASLSYQLVRVALAGCTLLVPTTLMGATLPLILRHFARSGSTLGRLGGVFYAINTLGAVAGTLAAGFALLPYLGTARATAGVAALNLLIGSVCVGLGLRSALPPGLAAPPRESGPGPGDAEAGGAGRAALIAFGLTGFGSFALEVAWTRILIVSVSATVYSFAAMLACFLFGIFLGSLLVSRFVDRHPDPLALFGGLLLGIASCVALLSLSINAVPGLFGALLSAFAGVLSPEGGRAFVGATLLCSFLLLVVPTTLLGATFPVALRSYAHSAARAGSRAGNLYAANTAGAIAGSLGAGLVLIPALGTRTTLACVAVLFAFTGTVLRTRHRGLSGWATPALGLPLLLILAVLAVAVSAPRRVVLNFNQKAGVETEVLYHAEGVQSTIDVVRSRSGVTSLVIDGNVEADDSLTQRRHFVLKGHLPLLLLEEPRSVLVIGLGMGITLAASARHPGVERIDVIELSPEILAAQGLLGQVNGDVARNPRVRIRIDDGRSYLKMGQGRYDMITADPIHPRVSGAGYLYTREYYQAIREMLKPGGIVCQWMPLYQISPDRLRSAMATFAEVFPDSSFWYVENHGLFVGRPEPFHIDYRQLAERFEHPAVRADLASVGIESPEELLSLRLLGPEEIRDYLDAGDPAPLNTDDHPYLEYFVPTDLFFGVGPNVQELARHAGDPAEGVAGLPDGTARRIRTLAAERREAMPAHGGPDQVGPPKRR